MVDAPRISNVGPAAQNVQEEAMEVMDLTAKEPKTTEVMDLTAKVPINIGQEKSSIPPSSEDDMVVDLTGPPLNLDEEASKELLKIVSNFYIIKTTRKRAALSNMFDRSNAIGNTTVYKNIRNTASTKVGLMTKRAKKSPNQKQAHLTKVCLAA